MGLHKFAKSLGFEQTSAAMQSTMESVFNATIEIIDPNIAEGTFDRVARTRTTREADVLWTGPARIQAMRWPNVANPKGEATALRTVVFHLPRDADITPTLVREGLRIRVTDGALAPEFVGGLFVVTTSVTSSYAWDRRIEALMDQGT